MLLPGVRWDHGCVLALKMNDAAVRMLGMLSGLAGVEPPGGLAAGLQERVAAVSSAAGRF
jgi:hypothetical protein